MILDIYQNYLFSISKTNLYSLSGLSHLETAQIFLKLMKRLGYDQFYLQGGDWGSIIATSMATMYPEK